MIIGSTAIDMSRLSKTIGNQGEFEKYCMSLIPVEFRHYIPILNNQKYYCIIKIRREDSIPWKDKKDFIECVLKDCRITGFCDSILECRHILSIINKKKVNEFYQEVCGSGKRKANYTKLQRIIRESR